MGSSVLFSFRIFKFELSYSDCGFVDALQGVADHIPQLVQGMRGSQAHPEDLGAQLALIIASQSFLQVKCTFCLFCSLRFGIE